MDISIIAGSSSDLDTIESAKKYLEFFNLVYKIDAKSAHYQNNELIEHKEALQAKIASANAIVCLPKINTPQGPAIKSKLTEFKQKGSKLYI